MRSIFKVIVVNFLTLLLIAKLSSLIDFSGNFLILFWAALSLSVLNLVVKPILNILLTPINFLTLGAFRWVINIIVLFLVTIFVPEFKVVGFAFGGLAYGGFTIPSVTVTSLWAFFLVSFTIELVQGVIRWLLQ